jgi:hypothetical protein
MSAVPSIADATWDDINALRDRLMARSATSVEHAAQAFAVDLAKTFPSIVLARIFATVPLERLQPGDHAYATTMARGNPDLRPHTRVLSLLGTAGADPAWCDRRLSAGHRAIPLLNRTFVQNAPMIAKLLADLEVDLAGLDNGSPIATRRMLGGLNNMFFVPDAQAPESDGRHVIAAQDFVKARGIRTVFGMGGSYVDGTLVIAIAFTTERIERRAVDRFPSLIGNFKMATGALAARGRLHEPEGNPAFA